MLSDENEEPDKQEGRLDAPSEAASDVAFSPAAIRRDRLVLLSAATLSIGSHFGSYLLGPLKTSFTGLSEAGFATLIESFYVLNTITPLIASALVQRSAFSRLISYLYTPLSIQQSLGSPRCALLATGIVVLGQLLVCLAPAGNVFQMSVGILLFSASLAPLSVVQETIMLRYGDATTSSKYVAAGLLCGKTAAFAASILAEPLSSLSPKAPFWTALVLAVGSFGSAVSYVWLDINSSLNSSVARVEVYEKSRPVTLARISRFGHGFWLYMGICACAGAWYVTIHLSASIQQSVFGIDRALAASDASAILFGSIPLYPILGYVLDRRPQSYHLIMNVFLSAVLVSYAAIITKALPHFLVLIPAALGIGGGPLLLVLAVPRVVDSADASTALGMHKSMEMAMAVIMQSIAARFLNQDRVQSSPETETRISGSSTGGTLKVLTMLFGVVAAQLVLALTWQRSHPRAHEQDGPNWAQDTSSIIYDVVPMQDLGDRQFGSRSVDGHEQREGNRDQEYDPFGRFGLAAFATCIGVAWITFLYSLLWEG